MGGDVIGVDGEARRVSRAYGMAVSRSMHDCTEGSRNWGLSRK